MANPYAFSDDEDADLFQENKRTNINNQTMHVLGGICPECGEIHTEDELPPEIRSHIRDFIAGLPEEIRDKIVNYGMAIESRDNGNQGTAFQFMDEFIKWSDGLFEIFNSSPMIKAMAVIMDEQTGGRLTRLTKVYEMELALHRTHRIKKSLNKYIDALFGPPDKPNEVDYQYSASTGFLMDFINERLDEMAEAYTQLCIVEGIEPDQTLIHTGCFDENSHPELSTLLFTKPIDNAITRS